MNIPGISKVFIDPPLTERETVIHTVATLGPDPVVVVGKVYHSDSNTVIFNHPRYSISARLPKKLSYQFRLGEQFLIRID